MLVVANNGASSLGELAMAENRIGDGGCADLCDAFARAGPAAALRSLDLAHNRLTDVCVGKVARLLTARVPFDGMAQTVVATKVAME